MLPLNTQAKVQGVRGVAILKVLEPEEAQNSGLDRSNCLLWLGKGPADEAAFPRNGWAGAILAEGSVDKSNAYQILISDAKTPNVIAPGDVVRLVEGSSRVSVLYRRGSNSNTLMATERCNSLCLMCSQPPKNVEDQWLVDEMIATIPLIDRGETQLGISGGEPTLLGDDLAAVINHARLHLPTTELHILSNGRRFSDKGFARAICSVPHPRVQWGIPIYSDCPEIHNYIHQSEGAWHETMNGLYNLAEFGASIELRVVVQHSNVERLGELAYYIFRNLTFVHHVAFMGLEPMGFAKRNYEHIWVDPVDCVEPLRDAVFYLSNRGMSVSIYNYPLCTMPKDLWPYCHKSISDWKNIYLPECDECDAKHLCAGFFRTVGPKWLSRAIRPLKEEPRKKEIEKVEAV